MKRLPVLLCLLLTCALAACPRPASAGLVELSVVDRDNGRELPQYHARGQHWVAGTPGHRYAVRLTNTSSERVLVVLSVDGVNAVSGEDAAPDQAGYVLAPWQSTQITGWRKSLNDVAQFVFTDLPDSYAARTGRPDNVGVIGIAVFRERHVYPEPVVGPPIAREPPAAGRPAPATPQAADATAAESMARQRLGTGHGAREWAPVSRTGFDRASRHPAQVTQLRYDDADALAAMGIIPRPYASQWPHPPRAFPGGFVPDP